MKNVLLFLIITFLILSPATAEDHPGSYSGSGNDITINGNTKSLDHTALLKAVLSEANAVGSFIEVGFSKTSEVGDIHEAITDNNKYSDDIVLTDADLDGSATANLYVFYKVLNQPNVSSISITIPNLTADNDGTTITMPLRVVLTLVKGEGDSRYDLISTVNPSQTLYSRNNTTNTLTVYSMALVASYESTGTNVYPALDYTGTLKINITGV